MRSRKLLGIVGVSLALSMLLIPVSGQAFANAPGVPKIEFNQRFPPIGSVYVVDLSGSAHRATTDIVKPISAHLEFNVTNLKTQGVPSISLTLIEGNVAVGDETYALTHGSSAVVPVHRINVKEYSDDSLKVLTIFASLTKPLPLSTSDEPVDLGPAFREYNGGIQINNQNWVLDDFNGNISRIK